MQPQDFVFKGRKVHNAMIGWQNFVFKGRKVRNAVIV
jgi:hypothetical protein